MAVPDNSPALAAGGTESSLAGIVGRVDTRALARRMVDIFRAELRSYRELPDDVLEVEVGAAARHNLELFFVSLTDGKALSDADLEPFRESASRRARDGVPLEDLLHAYRRGGQLGWEAIVAAARPGEQATLLPAVAHLLDYVDRVSHAVADTYHAEQRSLISAEERRLRDLFDTLLAGEPVDRAAREAAGRIGFPVVDRYTPFAAAGADGDPALARELRAGGTLAVSDGARAVGLIAADAVPPTPAAGVLIAVGATSEHTALAPALDDVRMLLDVGVRVGADGTITADDFLPELLLAGSPRFATRVHAVALGPLEDYASQRSGDLLETLDVFVGSGCERREAAQRLHVHPNTLDYRLKRIEQLTGLALARPADLLLYTLALKQRRLAAAEA